MKAYIVPSIKVKVVDVEALLAAMTVNDSDKGSDTTIDSGEEIEAKSYGRFSVWDD